MGLGDVGDLTASAALSVQGLGSGREGQVPYRPVVSRCVRAVRPEPEVRADIPRLARCELSTVRIRGFGSGSSAALQWASGVNLGGT